jgi:hypothetical protein
MTSALKLSGVCKTTLAAGVEMAQTNSAAVTWDEKNSRKIKERNRSGTTPLAQQIQTTDAELGTETALQAEGAGAGLEQTATAVDFAE